MHPSGDLPRTDGGLSWPVDPAALIALQHRLAAATPDPWEVPSSPLALGGCFVCFARGQSGAGAAGDLGWAGASYLAAQQVPITTVVEGQAGGPYEPGLLALREGPLLEAAVRRLPHQLDVLLVNATGRDHPRRAGLALHLGAVLGIPTVGVTHRPLLARGLWPPRRVGATSPLVIDDEVVGYWLRTRADTRPLAVHAAWRTDPSTAVATVLRALAGRRTPIPIAEARRAAREVRAHAAP